MVNDSEVLSFNLLLKEQSFLLVDFYADWCEPCKMLDSILAEVKKKLDTKIFIHKIDVDFSKDLSKFYQIMSVPVLILFKNGKPVWRMNGFYTANELLKIFEEFQD